MSALDWEALPRMLWELCDGPCMRRGQDIYALDVPGRPRQWYCRSCYLELWIAAGRPEQVSA
ncbi:hypothetical protein [Actinoplanes teichomyceticus]|uniref:Uncharacterized protein n=1 Tax=Actinoplanes teichomyceticus TaxID=1867 RepID=A0A561WAW0_ACTTI|nr:hypothetical protein [Actinoplanes teichomyceticus]TWG20985.1 hypothetical protein FHX34_103514 [Actinoplanes teichomyceticus]GIF14804.1 hypothetical protein Ate01nite_48360 [Actinoplanes teichomyceticus]